jgi:hypothetical protein
MEFIPAEKAVPIRFPSQANLLIDSRDRQGFNDGTFAAARPDITSANFIINKSNSIMNGYFTRIAPTEVCLDWCVDNINTYWGNTTLRFLPLARAGLAVSTITVPLANGEYTFAQALKQTISTFNANSNASTSQLTLSTIGAGGIFRGGEVSLQMFSTATLAPYQVVLDPLAAQMDLQGVAGTYVSSISQTAIGCPKILPTSYIDFLAPNLTYNQNLKDANTALTTNDILYRWYLAWDSPEPLDEFGYPIYQGYKRFIQRREIAFPKQIGWKANQPIGQLGFQVVDDAGKVLPPSLIGSGTTTANLSEMEWQMTCLVSEV